jgi:hypothetical protein
MCPGLTNTLCELHTDGGFASEKTVSIIFEYEK